MASTRIDDIARLFAQRRLSRQRAARRETPATATPGGTAATSPSMFLFVQSFGSGTIAPKAGTDGAYTVTLERGLGQTIYFSDRPERIVGTAPTAHFLRGFDFSAENPPNAALLVEGEGGETAIAVVELTNPSYDEATRTARYDVAVLAEFTRGAGLAFHPDLDGASALPTSFDAAHLFIDDCHGEVVACYPAGRSQSPEALLGYVKAAGMCWDPVALTCTECNPAPDVLACQAKYPDHCTEANPCEVVQIAP